MTENTYLKFSHLGLTLYCIFAALSIGVSQTIVVLTILLSLYFFFCGEKRNSQIKKGKALVIKYYKPIVFFVITSFVAVILGVDPVKAFFANSKTCFYLLLPLVVFYSLSLIMQNSKTLAVERISFYFSMLILSQSLASLHSIIETWLGMKVPPKIPGAVTESGQLVLVIPLAIALFVVRFLKDKQNISDTFSFKNPLILKLGVCFTLLLSIAWSNLLAASFDLPINFFVLSSFFLIGLTLCVSHKSEIRHLAFALLLAALVINLKRGPWAAVTLEIIILAFIFSKRLLVAVLVITCSLILLITPVRERLFSSESDFLISGGRKNMWQIGMELSERFPIGIGPENADYIRVVDPSLPPSHRHLHNNFLNILVETGSLGLIFYLWWMGVFILLGFSIWKRLKNEEDRGMKHIAIYSLCSGISLLGWQVAGLVEYNFGDGEVRLIAFFLMGILLFLSYASKRAKES